MENKAISTFLANAAYSYKTVFKPLIDESFQSYCADNEEHEALLFRTIMGDKFRDMVARCVYDKAMIGVNPTLLPHLMHDHVDEHVTRFLGLCNKKGFMDYIQKELDLAVDDQSTKNKVQICFH